MHNAAGTDAEITRITVELPRYIIIKLDKAKAKMGYQSRGAAIANFLDLLLSDNEECQHES